MFAGGALSWFVLMPLIALFGGDAVIFPGTVPISSMAPGDLWGSYIKYIGAGAVAAGGMISLIKTFPLIIRTFKQAMASMSRKHAESSLRTERDLPMPLLLGTIVVIAILIWLVPHLPGKSGRRRDCRDFRLFLRLCLLPHGRTHRLLQ